MAKRSSRRIAVAFGKRGSVIGFDINPGDAVEAYGSSKPDVAVDYGASAEAEAKAARMRKSCF